MIYTVCDLLSKNPPFLQKVYISDKNALKFNRELYMYLKKNYARSNCFDIKQRIAQTNNN